MKKIILICVVMCMLLSSCALRIDDTPYEYPLYPGTVEWKYYSSNGDIRRMLEIPEKKLKAMTTRALLETVLDYPFITDSFYYSSLSDTEEKIKDAYESIKNRHNGVAELLKRKDLTNLLLDKYDETEFVSLKDAQMIYDTGGFEYIKQSGMLGSIELLICCDQYENGGYSDKQRTRLIEILKEKMDEREKAVDYFFAPCGMFLQDKNGNIVS